MKIYNEIRIDIKTGKTLYEDSFEYNGPVAQCFGGGGSSVEYTQSPEQRDMYKLINPVISKLAGAAMGSGYGQSSYNSSGSTGNGYLNMFSGGLSGKGGKGGGGVQSQGLSDLYTIPNAPTAPTAPSMSDIPMYDIPDASTMMPTQNWWNSLSPEVMQGLWSPYNAGANQMMETMGAGGNLGSARGGYSGTGENALGRFYADASNDVGMQAWNMTQPAMQANWSAQLGANQAGYNQNVTDYQNQLNQQQQNYALDTETWRQQIAREQLPFSILPGLIGGTYSTPVVSQGSGGIGSMVTGAASGLGTAALASMGPWGMAGMAGLGLLGGL